MTPADPGLRFELRVFKMIQRAILNGALGIAPSNARSYHRKSYQSAERKAPIVFDIAIEVFRDGAVSPFLLWIWECKAYTRPVPVDDIEEFHAKLQQIGGDRTKGTVASLMPFQTGAVEYARTHGIGLARVIDRKGFAFDLEDVTALTSEQIEQCLTGSDLDGLGTEFLGLTADARPVSELKDMIRLEIKP